MKDSTYLVIGCCDSKSPVEVFGRQPVSDSESSTMSQENFTVNVRENEVPEQPEQPHQLTPFVMEMVYFTGSVYHGFLENPSPLKALKAIAERDEGWQRVMEALVASVPSQNPLGPTVISLIFNDCPLPCLTTLKNTLDGFNICSERAIRCVNTGDQRFDRNLVILIGCMADKFIGPMNTRILTEDIIGYIYVFMTQETLPDILLQCLCTLEKFSRSKTNRKKFEDYFAKQGVPFPLLALESHFDSEDVIWHLIGFMARWLLDNLLFAEGRAMSYTRVDMAPVNAMLDVDNATGSLKIGSDGLEARCDSGIFETVRCTYKVTDGVFYYEVEVLTAGGMYIGWVYKKTRQNKINDDIYSTLEEEDTGEDDFIKLAYDGNRRLLLHGQVATEIGTEAWAPGDIVGCLLDVPGQEAVFTLNGLTLYRSSMLVEEGIDGYYASASFMSSQAARFNFGGKEFRFLPDREFNTFNEVGILTPEQKEVIIPRWLRAEQVKAAADAADCDANSVCVICLVQPFSTILSPCRHRVFCRECAVQLTECPLCRGKIWHFSVQPLLDVRVARLMQTSPVSPLLALQDDYNPEILAHTVRLAMSRMLRLNLDEGARYLRVKYTCAYKENKHHTYFYTVRNVCNTWTKPKDKYLTVIPHIFDVRIVDASALHKTLDSRATQFDNTHDPQPGPSSAQTTLNHFPLSPRLQNQFFSGYNIWLCAGLESEDSDIEVNEDEEEDGDFSCDIDAGDGSGDVMDEGNNEHNDESQDVDVEGMSEVETVGVEEVEDWSVAQETSDRNDRPCCSSTSGRSMPMLADSLKWQWAGMSESDEDDSAPMNNDEVTAQIAAQLSRPTTSTGPPPCCSNHAQKTLKRTRIHDIQEESDEE